MDLISNISLFLNRNPLQRAWTRPKIKCGMACMRATRRCTDADSPPSLASMPDSTIHRQTLRSLWNSGPRGAYHRDRWLDDKNQAVEDRGMLACTSSLCTKAFPGRNTIDTGHRKPVNFTICLHVAECRDYGQSPNVYFTPRFNTLPSREGPMDREAEPSQVIRRKGLYDTSQSTLVLKEAFLDQNTIVNVKPHKERITGVTAGTRRAFSV